MPTRLRWGCPPRGQPGGRSHVPPALRLGLQLFSRAAAHPRLFALSQRLAGIFSRLAPASAGWMRLPAFTGWGLARDFPRPALKPFSASKLAAGLSPKPAPEAPALETRKAAIQQIAESLRVLEKPEPGATPAPLTGQSPLRKSAAERFALELSALGGTAVRCRSERAGRAHPGNAAGAKHSYTASLGRRLPAAGLAGRPASCRPAGLCTSPTRRCRPG